MSSSIRLVAFSREVTDVYGRRYRIGETPEELTGHPREHQAWRAWLCLAAISPLQYLFGFAVLGLPASNVWSGVDQMWLLAVFVVVQAGTALPTAWLNRDHRFSPRGLVLAGGVLAAVGLASLGHAGNLVVATLGYAGLGGVGAGLIYSTTVATAARWFPDRRISTIAFVTGAYACGAVPGIMVLTLATSERAHVIVLDVLAVVALLVVTTAGSRLVRPPHDWWPSDINPQLWAIDHELNPSLPHNQPAVREYAPSEALRTAALPLLWFVFAAVSAVSLFGIGFISHFAVEAGLGVTTAGLAAAGLAAVSGLGRWITARLSDLFGRSHLLGLILVVEGAAQLGLALSGHLGSPAGFVFCAMLAGLGGGGFYAIFATLALEFFGQHNVLQNEAVLYCAKAAGGVIGIGIGALLVSGIGYSPAFAIAGGVGLVAVSLVRLLKQPGRPVLATHG